MRVLSLQEVKSVAGGLEDYVYDYGGGSASYDWTIMDAAGLNNSGAFSAIDALDYGAIASGFNSLPPAAPTEGIDSWNFVTPTGAAVNFGIEVIEHIYDTYIKP